MMRRFTRRRRGGARPASGAAPIDPSTVLQRIVEQQLVPASQLDPFPADEVPGDFAVLGSGEARSGGRLLVSFAPRDGSHALVAALAVGGRMVETESFAGEIYAVAPEWGSAGRRLLGLLGPLAYRIMPVAAPSLAEPGTSVSPEAVGSLTVVSPAQIAGHLARPADRDLFLRAARGLEGLAAKHGGALRGYGRAVEFVLLARRVAELRAESGGVVLTTLQPQQSTARLTPESLSNALDALEGQLRKRLNDRRTREGEEGVRARAISAFRTWHSLRSLVPWPLGGGDEEVIDWVGVDVEGRPVIGAVREHLGLDALAEIVDAALRLQVSLPSVLAQAAAPVVLDTPRLVVGGREIAPGVGRVLEGLALGHELFQMRGRDGDIELTAVAAGEAPQAERPSRRRPVERPRREVEELAEVDDEETSAPDEDAESGVETRSGEGRGRSRRRGRGRRGRGRREGGAREGGGRESETEDESGASEPSEDEGARGTRFEEVSLFDLDDEPGEREAGGRPRRRGRGRRRPRGGSGDESRRGSADDASASGADGPSGREESRRSGAGAETKAPAEAEAEDDVDESFLTDDADLELEDLGEDVPDFEAEPAPRYEEDEEGEEDREAEAGEERQPRTRSRAPSPLPEVVADVPKLARRRSAILAHADRDSIVAAVLIARDIRMLEGLWVYPQSELMNFFRGAATDLRDDTPIYVVGFTPSPAVDVLQAASLYRDRMMWFDHQQWPPEDLQALRDVLGEDNVQVAPGTGSSLPAVLDCCSRRSRFTDKLVDLMAARFSHHDYERWGRVWWWRLGEIAMHSGDRRADVDELLSGRPSDLAREAARVETPAVPPEVDWVSRRDFRLVHFAGYALVVLEVPEELDVHLTARIARERYGSPLSLARRTGSEYVFFGGDELAGRRSLDLSALAEHISNKLEWVDRLHDSDHVARIRVRDLSRVPERLDEIVAEIAMGRSILER